LRYYMAVLLALCLAVPGAAVTDVASAFYPSGTMGDWGDVSLVDTPESPHSGPSCTKITYSASQSQNAGWAGICWLYPDSNTGSEPGRNLVGSTKLSFWARGALGGETAEFSLGGGGPSDSLSKISTGSVALTTEWQQYSLDLTEKDLSSVVSGFCWRAEKSSNPTGCTIYLDDMQFE
jgi:hypothetical protein